MTTIGWIAMCAVCCLAGWLFGGIVGLRVMFKAGMVTGRLMSISNIKENQKEKV